MMKKGIGSGSVLFVVVLILLLSAATIVIMRQKPADTYKSPIVTVTLSHDKGWLPTFQENFSRQGETARSDIGIDIKAIPSDTTELYIHQMKATLPTNQAPDLFTWWSTFRVKELVDENLVGDLSHLWDKYRDDYPRGIRDAFTIDGRQYGFPYGVDYWPVWYNKEIFSRLGLKEPGNWKEFITICEALKAAGIPPILASVQYKWPSFIWFEEMMIGEDPDLYEQLCKGQIKYTHSGVKKAFRIWGDMIRKGYFTDPSASMMSNGGYLWLKEKYGMVLAGTWYYSNVLLAHGVDPESIGVFILPSHNSNAGKNIIVEMAPMFTARNARHPEAAVRLADWWMGSRGHEHFARLHEIYPGNMNVDTGYLPPVKEKLIQTVKREKYRVLNRFWEASPVQVGTVAVEKFGEFMLNPDDLDRVLAELQLTADLYWSLGE